MEAVSVAVNNIRLYDSIILDYPFCIIVCCTSYCPGILYCFYRERRNASKKKKSLMRQISKVRDTFQREASKKNSPQVRVCLTFAEVR